MTETKTNTIQHSKTKQNKANDTDRFPKDLEDIDKRIIINEQKIQYVSKILEDHYGGRLTVDLLRMFARRLSKSINKFLDPYANKNRLGLLCWYAENWDELKSHLDEYIPSHSVKANKKELDSLIEYPNPIDPSDINQLINFH
ncbi:hypothetical protein TVAG_102140 [Trichomonas vaginalis G3]|uniref:Uncharacterized protein n=1 Tax=Trichomonas vaginalis (strain ATCC PRA-98 / G3) TaxID=412133 RepID=A2FEH2_TRIV3|nr:hypothetical protein TVAGG3_0701030 [Trichomonas vaginalis G3]EAX96709.1 hypothetical protein TVAG_102140 [Trichomonas vaginalis G3]KAI5509237.1 hypothetical protein TVAGG3_0701030 [Trichomonas vaginalis G3]|eukprot:XP_001309639.1 hypothetical protein [Trichomonas vaginalis G3]